VLKAYKHGAGVLKAYKHEAGCFDHKAVVILNTGTLGLYLNGSIYYFIVFKRIVLEWNAKLIAKAIGLQDTVLPPPTHESTLSDNIKQRHWQAPLTKLVQDRQNQQTNWCGGGAKFDHASFIHLGAWWVCVGLIIYPDPSSLCTLLNTSSGSTPPDRSGTKRVWGWPSPKREMSSLRNTEPLEAWNCASELLSCTWLCAKYKTVLPQKDRAVGSVESCKKIIELHMVVCKVWGGVPSETHTELSEVWNCVSKAGGWCTCVCVCVCVCKLWEMCVGNRILQVNKALIVLRCAKQTFAENVGYTCR